MMLLPFETLLNSPLVGCADLGCSIPVCASNMHVPPAFLFVYLCSSTCVSAWLDRHVPATCQKHLQHTECPKGCGLMFQKHTIACIDNTAMLHWHALCNTLPAGQVAHTHLPGWPHRARRGAAGWGPHDFAQASSHRSLTQIFAEGQAHTPHCKHDSCMAR